MKGFWGNSTLNVTTMWQGLKWKFLSSNFHNDKGIVKKCAWKKIGFKNGVENFSALVISDGDERGEEEHETEHEKRKRAVRQRTVKFNFLC